MANKYVPQKFGLLSKIKMASSEGEANSLLAEGALYQNATPDTQRKWKKAAAKLTSVGQTNG